MRINRRKVGGANPRGQQTQEMLPTSRCCMRRSPICSLFSYTSHDKPQKRGFSKSYLLTEECVNCPFKPHNFCLSAKPMSTYILSRTNSRYVYCIPSLGKYNERPRYRHFHSPGEGTSGEDEDVGAVREYSFDELLDRIAQAQLKKDERIVKLPREKTEKKQMRSKPVTLMNINKLVEFLRTEGARDVCVIKIPPERDYVEYFVVCGGLGTRHIRTMADNLVAEVKGRGDERGGRTRVEGRESDEWMAVDLGFAVVHLMADDARRRYELEKLWTLGPRYDDQLISMSHATE